MFDVIARFDFGALAEVGTDHRQAVTEATCE